MQGRFPIATLGDRPTHDSGGFGHRAGTSAALVIGYILSERVLSFVEISAPT